MLQVAGAKLWGLSRFQIASFIFESHFYHPIVLETFVCKMSATDYGVFRRLYEVCTFNLDKFNPVALNSFFFGKKWVECPVLFELLQDPTTHCFTIVKTKKYFCRRLDNTRACKGPKDVFDFWWAEIPLMMSQQRWQNQNCGRSELSEVILGSKCACIKKKIKDLWSTFGIHSTPIKQNCTIFGFTCPLRPCDIHNWDSELFTTGWRGHVAALTSWILIGPWEND